MGYYINPPGGDKLRWLQENGQETPPAWRDITAGYLPVCLVDNGPYTAAAVCYNREEFEEFSRPDDPRPRRWFLVKTARLLEVVPQLARVVVA